jgi:hypothetical protein
MPPQVYDRGDIVLLPNKHRGIVSHCNESSVVVHDAETGKDYYVYKRSDVAHAGEATEVVDDNSEYIVAGMLFDYMLSNGTGEDIDDCLVWNRDNIGPTKNPMLRTIVREVIDELRMECEPDPRKMRDKMKRYRFFYKLFVKEASDVYYLRIAAPVIRDGKKQKLDA